MPIVIITLLVVAIAGVGFFVSRDTTTTPSDFSENQNIELIPVDNTPEPAAENSDENKAPEAITTSPTEVETAIQTTDDVDTYKDGEYTATASHSDPKRKNHNVKVTLTILDDTVTAATVLYNGAEAHTPNHTRFDENYKSLVIGKPLDSISLARVGGASLTTEAFNEAVESIKAEAKS